MVLLEHGELTGGGGFASRLVNSFDLLHRHGAACHIHFPAVAVFVVLPFPHQLCPKLRKRVRVLRAVMLVVDAHKSCDLSVPNVFANPYQNKLPGVRANPRLTSGPRSGGGCLTGAIPATGWTSPGPPDE